MVGRARLPVAMAAVGVALYAVAGCSWSLDGFTGGEDPDAAVHPDVAMNGEASTDAGAADDDGDAAAPVFLSIDPAMVVHDTAYDLTALGPLDWAQFTKTRTTRCAPCAPRIEMLGVPAQSIAYTDDLRTFSWTNGTPVASGSATEGIFFTSVGDSLDLYVSAAPTRAVLTLHLDTYYAGATLTAEIVGAAGTPRMLALPIVDDTALYAAKVRFSGPAGSSIHLTWTLTAAHAPPDVGGMGNIAIIAATLAPE